MQRVVKSHYRSTTTKSKNYLRIKRDENIVPVVSPPQIPPASGTVCALIQSNGTGSGKNGEIEKIQERERERERESGLKEEREVETEITEEIRNGKSISPWFFTD